jgi:hypothetical protein
MGVECYAMLVYGVKFSFKELEHLKTNPIVVAEPDEDFGYSLSDFWCGEFEGVLLLTVEPEYSCYQAQREHYAASPRMKSRDGLSKDDVQAALKDEVFIKDLKFFCKNFGLEYKEPKFYCALDISP